MVNTNWKVYHLSDIGTFCKGSGISRDESHSGTIPAVRYGELYTTHNYYIKKYTSKISDKVAQKARKVKYGDVLFACSGETKEDIAKCAAIVDDFDVYAGGDIIIFSPSVKTDPIFMGYILNTEDVVRQRSQLAQGDAIVHISSEAIKSIEIPLPDHSEQEAIAAALSDMDALIDNLEKLIAKKKAIKQGAMQELLTGKRRLPGFTGEWKKESFSEIYDFAKEGGTPSTSNEQFYRDGSIPFAKIDDLYEKYVESCSTFITPLGLEHSSAWLIPSNSLLLSNGATIGLVSINSIPLATKQGIIGIIPKKEYDIEFLYYVFSSNMFYEKLKNITTHGTMDFAYIKDVNQIVIEIPCDVQEQKAIASVLSDMDNELKQLENNLSKYKNIKSGMMSELLTGRIRLV